MPYPRSVILEACLLLGIKLGYHGEFEDMVLRWELDQLADASGLAIHARCRNLFRYVRDNVTLVWLHTRLIAELLLCRWPLVLGVRRRWLAAGEPAEVATARRIFP